jgi:hypothetical protein
MKTAIVKSGVTTSLGAMTQAGLNAITNLEETFDKNKTKLDIAGQYMVNKYKKIKGVEGRSTQVQHADVELLVFELVSRYIENPDSFTEKNIKDLSLILSKNGKYIVIDKLKYERFLNERSDAATAGLLVSALTSSTIDLMTSLLPQEEPLSRGENFGISSGLGVSGVLGSNLLVNLITNYKDTKLAKEAAKIIATRIDTIRLPTSIPEANQNLTKLSKWLEDICDSNSKLINSIMIKKAESARIIRNLPSASALVDTDAKKAKEKENKEIKERLILDTSELDSNMLLMERIFKAIAINEKYIADHTTFRQDAAKIISGRALNESVNKVLETNPFDFFTKKNGGRHYNTKTRKIPRNKRHPNRKNKRHKKKI